MKIEDIYYELPTNHIAPEKFDRDKWVQENPIDYFKLLYILFASKNIEPSIPDEIALGVASKTLYRVTRLYIPDTLYKYSSLTSDEELNQKKLLTLKNKQIYMSDIKDFNDPFDGKAFFYKPSELSNIKRLADHNGQFIDDFTILNKGTSLTENDTNCMPMWAHYANNHQGYCVAYDMNNPDNHLLSSCTFPIQYTDQRLDITSFMKRYAEMILSEVDRQITQGKTKIGLNDLSLIYIVQYMCNVKHSTWQYEKEYRCTMGANSEGMPFVNAFPKAIYIGMNCCETNRKELISIAQKYSIPIYQMKLDNFSENYVLEAKPL